MKKIFLIVLLSVSANIWAQSKPFQLSIGLNQSWYRYKEDLGAPTQDFRPLFNASFSYKFMELGDFTSNIGIRYYDLGRSITLTFLVDETKIEEKSKIDFSMLSFPVQLKYYIKTIHTNLVLNVEPSYVLKGKITSTPIFTGNSGDITDEMKHWNFALGVGLEYNFIILGQSFGITSIYNYGLTELPKSENWMPFKISELNLAVLYYF